MLLARVLHEDLERRPPVGLGEGHRVDRFGVGHALVDLGRDDPLVRDDLAVLAVEADLEIAVRNHHVPPLAADPQVDLGDGHLAAVGVPPALHELGRGERLVDQVLRCVELPRDEDLLIGGQRHLRRSATHCHRLPPSA
jgi:hypothetical protein